MKRIRKILQWLAVEPFRSYRRGRLLRHYFLISALLIAGGLIASGLLEVYLRYQESREQLAFQQREAATVAALKIQTFIHDIETAMKAATKYQSTSGQEIAAAEYEFELKKLFYLAPAITEAAVVSVDGISRAHFSRSRAVTPDVKRNFSGSAAFQQPCKDNLISARCTSSANQSLTSPSLFPLSATLEGSSVYSRPK